MKHRYRTGTNYFIDINYQYETFYQYQHLFVCYIFLHIVHSLKVLIRIRQQWLDPQWYTAGQLFSQFRGRGISPRGGGQWNNHHSPRWSQPGGGGGNFNYSSPRWNQPGEGGGHRNPSPRWSQPGGGSGNQSPRWSQPGGGSGNPSPRWSQPGGGGHWNASPQNHSQNRFPFQQVKITKIVNKFIYLLFRVPVRSTFFFFV